MAIFGKPVERIKTFAQEWTNDNGRKEVTFSISVKLRGEVDPRIFEWNPLSGELGDRLY